MINPYRTLSSHLPERTVARGAGSPVDAKSLQAWVDNLPRANPEACVQHLSQALEDLRLRQLEGFARLEALEVLRPAMLESIALLTNRLQGSTFPLTGTRIDIAANLLSFQRELALEYRMAIVEACVPAGKVPFLRGSQVTLALVRAMYHHVRWLATCYFLYRAPEPRAWLNIYALAAFAQDHKLHAKPVEDGAERCALGVSQLLNQAVLLSLANPYRFNQRELVELWVLTRDAAGWVELTPQRFSASGAVVLMDEDTPPTFVNRAPDPAEGDTFWVDIRKLIELVENAVSSAEDGGEAILRLSREQRLSFPKEMLGRALEGWNQDISRIYPRLKGGYSFNSLIGLSALHQQLSGSLPVSQNVGEAATGGIIEVQVLDQSLGGYRLRWESTQGVRIRIGEMIGVTLPGGSAAADWMVGIVRWLRYSEAGAVEAGIDLVARRAQAALLRGLDVLGKEREPVRGIRLLSVPENQDVPGLGLFLVHSITDIDTPRLEVVREGERWLELEEGNTINEVFPALKNLRRHGDYRLIGIENACA